jgi:FkbM family methyltransferase
LRTIFPYEAEDELKEAYLRDINQGFFVEVGANGPRTLSQTYALEQRGWTGVLVEPQPDLAAELRRQRSAKVFAEACTSRRNSGSRMLLHLAGGHSSFDQNLNIADVKPHGTIEVPTRTLDQILTDAGAQRVDFISIDVEGHELEVLDGFDFERWQPRLMIVEDLLLNLRLHRYITRRNYRWLRRTGIDSWYVPEKTSSPRGIDGSWQFFNKVYLGTPLRRVRMAARRLTRVPRFVSETRAKP